MNVEPWQADSEATRTSTSLICRLQVSDREAWARFVDLYGPLVWQWCRKSGLSSSDAEDVGQNVFAGVAVGIAKYQNRGSFRGWLWQVTRNKLMDHFRKQRHLPKVVGGTEFNLILGQLPEIEPSELSIVEPPDTLAARALEIIRREFEETTWLAFVKMVFEKKSAAEVARELNWIGEGVDEKKATGRVRQAKFRIIKRLKEEFGEVLDLEFLS